MVQKFVSAAGDFTCDLESRQCEAMTTKDHRCKRRTRQQQPFCFQHIKSELGVELKDSPGKGKGVFALQTFKPGKFIMPYGGEIIDQKELDRRYGHDTAEYAIKIGDKDKYADAACLRGIGAMCNTNPGNNNADMIQKGRRGCDLRQKMDPSW